MLPVLILALTAMGAALLRLWSYRAQMLVPSTTAVNPPPATRDRIMLTVAFRTSRTRARAIRANAQWGSHIQNIYCRISGRPP